MKKTNHVIFALIPNLKSRRQCGFGGDVVLKLTLRRGVILDDCRVSLLIFISGT